MKLLFEPNLDYQMEAIEAVCDLFRGQEQCRTEFTVTHELAGPQASLAFAESDLVTPSLVEAIRSGEQSGQLATLMLNMSDFLDEENEVVVKSLTSILEPLILIGLGILVGFIAISMFLPLFDLTSLAQGGGH